MANLMTTVVNTGTGTDYTLSKITDIVRAVYSKEILFEAQPVLFFDQFAVKKTELNTEPGLSIKVVSYANVAKGGELQEGVHITTKALNSSMIEITVKEYGNAIGVSELTLKASFDDVMKSASKLLGYDYAQVLDGVVRDALLVSPNVVYGGGKASRANLTTADKLSTATVKDAVEVLATNNTPKISRLASPEGVVAGAPRAAYVCFAHPHNLRGLRDDNNWIEASKYGAPNQLFNGEVGRYEDVLFIETTQVNKITGLTPIDPIYQSIMIGADAYGIAFGLPVEMRDNGIQDFGREHGLAWYSIFGAKILDNKRVVILETA